jgi:hypothetical protein
MTPQGLFDALEGGIDIATTLGLSLDPSWGSHSQVTIPTELPLEDVLNALDKEGVSAFLREYPTPREDIPPLVPISSGEFESILESMKDSTY